MCQERKKKGREGMGREEKGREAVQRLCPAVCNGMRIHVLSPQAMDDMDTAGHRDGGVHGEGGHRGLPALQSRQGGQQQDGGGAVHD
eukprot:1158733-Pelagomonas_calceolata.AAC.4